MDPTTVKCRSMNLDGLGVFYREAGPVGAPVVLLPHGYPCSSYAFRNLMPRLADRFHLIAPDLPGCGYSATPDGFAYSFDGYASFLEQFTRRLRVDRYAIFLHDFGFFIGVRFAMRAPERMIAAIIQNSDMYEDTFGPKYALLKAHWRQPTSETRRRLAEAISLEGFRDEFENDLDEHGRAALAPDLWQLHWSLMTPRRREIAQHVLEGLHDNLGWFPRYQAFFRDRQPPTLPVWGPRDGYTPEPAARSFLRALPSAELELFEGGGHWLLETHLEQVVRRVQSFLERVHPAQH